MTCRLKQNISKKTFKKTFKKFCFPEWTTPTPPPLSGLSTEIRTFFVASLIANEKKS